jgi:hypothetical protein
MANPYIHSLSSVKRWGGKVEDYIAIHELLDSCKSVFNDNRSRVFTHNSWFCREVLPKCFGYNIINSDGKRIDVVDVGMLHVCEDYGMKFIPTGEMWCRLIPKEPWMNNGVKPINDKRSELFATTLLDRLRNLRHSVNKLFKKSRNEKQVAKTLLNKLKELRHERIN